MTSASASTISPNDRRLSPRDATFPLHNRVKGRLSRGVIFVYCGFLPESIYLFLGDYVDHAKPILDAITLMFVYEMIFRSSLFVFVLASREP